MVSVEKQQICLRDPTPATYTVTVSETQLEPTPAYTTNIGATQRRLVELIDNQRGRRNLTKQAWLELGFKRAELLKPRAKDNQGRRTDIFQESEKSYEPVNTVKEAADYAGVSVDTAAKYKRVMSNAPEDVREKVRTGETSILFMSTVARECSKPTICPLFSLSPVLHL